jgi:hypothetical protein
VSDFSGGYKVYNKPVSVEKTEEEIVAPAVPWDPKQATWLARAESKGVAVRVWSEETSDGSI